MLYIICSLILLSISIILNIKTHKYKLLSTIGIILSIVIFVLPVFIYYNKTDTFEQDLIRYKEYIEDDFDQYGEMTIEHHDDIVNHNKEVDKMMNKSIWFKYVFGNYDLEEYKLDPNIIKVMS